MKGRFLPPLYFLYLSLCLYTALMLLNMHQIGEPWIDRALILEIQLTGLATVVALLSRTNTWSRRGLGIWGFMLAAVILTTISQLVIWHLIPVPAPYWVINLYRAPMGLGAGFILYGYHKWRKGEEWDDGNDAVDTRFGDLDRDSPGFHRLSVFLRAQLHRLKRRYHRD